MINNYSKQQLAAYLEDSNNKLAMAFKYIPRACNHGQWDLISLEEVGSESADLWDHTAEKDELFTLEAMVLEFNRDKEDSYATTGMQLIQLPHSGMKDLLKIGLTGGFEQRTILLREGQTINAFSTMESYNFVECQDPQTETFLIVIGYIEENLSL